MQTKLRDYQLQAVDAMSSALDALEHPLCKIPTGGGKSLVLAELVRRRNQPTLVLSHVRELLEQDSRALRRVAPDMPQGFFSAGLREKRGGARVVFGSVQSVVRSLDELGARSLLLIDEAHLCPRAADAMYARVFDHFSLALRGGFTATDRRLDSGSLISGDDRWFTVKSTDVPVADLIKRGFLVPLSGVLTEHQASLAGVKSRGGEFIAEQAEEAVLKTLTLAEAVAESVKLAAKRKRWLVFAAGVKHAHAVHAELRAQGIDARLVTGETAAGEREETVSEFREGDFRALVNIGVFTTGFDAPEVDCIICLRPTRSPILWEQLLGRGMRTASAKKDCLLLDFVGNLERLGGVGCVLSVQDNRKPPEGAPPRKVMKKSEREEAQLVSASLADPMKDGRSFECDVQSVHYFIANSRRFQNRRMLIAQYFLEDEFGRSLQAKSFVCVEYAGSARYLATLWFARREIEAKQVPTDAVTALALAKVLPIPREVRVYWDPRMRCYLIMEESFDDQQRAATRARARQLSLAL